MRGTVSKEAQQAQPGWHTLTATAAPFQRPLYTLPKPPCPNRGPSCTSSKASLCRFSTPCWCSLPLHDHKHLFPREGFSSFHASQLLSKYLLLCTVDSCYAVWCIPTMWARTWPTSKCWKEPHDQRLQLNAKPFSGAVLSSSMA